MKNLLQTLFYFLLVTQNCFSQGFWTRWSEMPNMPENRYAHTVDEISGKIYIAGGINFENDPFPTTALVYDRSSGEWDTIPLFNNESRAMHTSCLVGGKLYLIGGIHVLYNIMPSMDIYDPGTGDWTRIDSLYMPRVLAACAVVDDTIYVIGGMPDFSYVGSKTVQAYNTNTGEWTSKAEMPTGRWGCSATVYNGKIYVFGGRSLGAPYSSIEVYDPQNNTWDTTTGYALLPTPRYCLTSCLLDSNIFVIGGWYHSSGGPLYNEVEVYNPQSDTWRTDTPLPAKLAVLACTVFDDKIYVFGGSRTTHPNYGTSVIYEYSDKDIFALNPSLDKTYARVNIDSVLLVTRFKNIYQHQFSPHIIYSDLDSTQIDSVMLFDDGLHGDSLANDGLYGGYIPPLQEEVFFTLCISTVDNQTNKYYNTPDRCRFTTVGPVKVDSLVYDVFPTYYRVKPYLTNQSNSTTITNAVVKPSCSNPWVTSIIPETQGLPYNILPGTTVTTPIPFTVMIDTSIFQNYFDFKVEITIDRWTYWQKIMRVPPSPIISIIPPVLNFGGVALDSSVVKTFGITNFGTEDLVISNITSNNPAFTVNNSSGVIQPDSTKQVEVTFTPTVLQTYNGVIEITHNAIGSPDTVIVTGDCVTGVEEELQPLTFSLEQNYPNPFNPSTTIKYSIPELSKVKLTLFNLLGEEVATLVNEEKVSGNYTVDFNATNLPSGVYFYQLKAGEYIETKKMILIK